MGGQIPTLIQQIFIEFLLCVSTVLSPRHTTLKKKKQERQNPHHHGTEIRVMSGQSLNKVTNKLACQMVLGAGESLGIAGRGRGGLQVYKGYPGKASLKR